MMQKIIYFIYLLYKICFCNTLYSWSFFFSTLTILLVVSQLFIYPLSSYVVLNLHHRSCFISTFVIANVIELFISRYGNGYFKQITRYYDKMHYSMLSQPIILTLLKLFIHSSKNSCYDLFTIYFTSLSEVYIYINLRM